MTMMFVVFFVQRIVRKKGIQKGTELSDSFVNFRFLAYCSVHRIVCCDKQASEKMNLKVGYSPNRDCFGPEFNFGQVMGDLFEEPVLLIKTAWGGKALGREFLPPSLRNTNKKIKALAVREKKTVQEILETYGVFYDLMIDEINYPATHNFEDQPHWEETNKQPPHDNRPIRLLSIS